MWCTRARVCVRTFCRHQVAFCENGRCNSGYNLQRSHQKHLEDEVRQQNINGQRDAFVNHLTVKQSCNICVVVVLCNINCWIETCLAFNLFLPPPRLLCCGHVWLCACLIFSRISEKTPHICQLNESYFKPSIWCDPGVSDRIFGC